MAGAPPGRGARRGDILSRAWTMAGERPESPARRSRGALIPWLAAAVLVSGLALSAAGAVLWQRQLDDDRRSEFRARADRLAVELGERLRSYESTLAAGRGLWAAFGEPSREQFRTYAEQLDILRRHPGMQGFGYIARVPDEEVDGFLAAARADGAPALSIRPGGRRDEHRVILYNEPAELLAAAVGFDVATIPRANEALDRARDSGAAAVSAPLTLVLDEDLPEAAQQRAFAMYLPVYAGAEVPPTREERRAALAGWMNSPFRAQDFLEEAFPDVDPDLVLRLRDRTARREEVLAVVPAGAAQPASPGFATTVATEVGGRDWALDVVSSDAGGASRWAGWVVFLLGALLTSALTALVTGLRRSEQEAQELAAAAQSELAERERRYRLLAEHSTDLVAVHDLEGRYRYVSPASRELLGREPDELLGRSPLEHVDPEDRAVVADAFRKVAGAAEPVTFVCRALHKGGEVVHLEVSVQALQVGGERQLHSSARDVTPRVLAEQALRESQQRLELIQRNAPLGLAVADFEGKWVEVNPALAALLRYPVEALVGRRFQEFTHPEDVELDAPLIERMLSGEITGYTIEKRYLRADGKPVWVNLSTTIVRDERDRPLYRVAQIQDITARRSAEQALEAARGELEHRYQELEHLNADLIRSNAELEEFAYVASHDLTEPLRVIGGFVELLREDHAEQLGEDGAEYLRFITGGVERMQQLIDDLLTYSRVGSRSGPMDPVALDDVVDEAVRQLASLTSRGAQLSRDPLPAVVGDRSQLVQLYQNLLGNAVKFVPPERVPRIHLSARRDGQRWRLAVSDNGIGIELRHREQIFRMFQRLHRRDEYPGTGIGLAICRRIAERHGGTIWVEDGPDGGSSLVFTLPAVSD